MPCGLFGKLPAKRDFIAVNIPQEFLTLWETWLQGGLSASKIALGKDWLPAYLSAPLWRFWLGAGVCGLPVTGVIMSSVDGVGRHFPLTVFASGEAGDIFALPAENANAVWYDGAEDFVLNTLEPDMDYAITMDMLDKLPLPARSPVPDADAGISELMRAMVASVSSPDLLPEACTRLETEERRRLYHDRAYFWTVGGENFHPACLMSQGMPDPNIFGAMLNGAFATVGA
jgi:type VI secretion system protein ImpM